VRTENRKNWFHGGLEKPIFSFNFHLTDENLIQ